MALEKMAPEKKAPGKNVTRKKWHYANLEKMAPYLFCLYSCIKKLKNTIYSCNIATYMYINI